MAYLDAEQLIIDRLKTLAPNVAVLSAADLAGVKEASQVTPALHVLYGGDDVPQGQNDRAGGGAAQMVVQHWTIWVVVKNAAGSKFSRKDAGALLDTVLTGLSGHVLAPNMRPLYRISSPPPDYSAGGFAYFPLRFAQRMVTP